MHIVGMHIVGMRIVGMRIIAVHFIAARIIAGHMIVGNLIATHIDPGIEAPAQREAFGLEARQGDLDLPRREPRPIGQQHHSHGPRAFQVATHDVANHALAVLHGQCGQNFGNRAPGMHRSLREEGLQIPAPLYGAPHRRVRVRQRKQQPTGPARVHQRLEEAPPLQSGLQ